MVAQPTLRRWLGAAMVLAAVAAGCSRSTDEDSGPQATVPRATTSSTISVAEVPEKIDVAYAQAVIDTLDQVTGDAVRFLAAARGPSMDFYIRLKAAWDEPGFEHMQSLFGKIAARDMEGLRQQPGNPRTTIDSLLDASPRCILTQVTRTFEGFYTEAPPADTLAAFVHLRRKNPERDPQHLNPTPWAIVNDVNAQGASVPENLCKP